MPYVPARDDADGFVCDGEWVSRSDPGLIDRRWEAMEEWQERIDEVAAAPGCSGRSPDGEGGPTREEPGPGGRRDIPLDGLKHGGGKPHWRLRILAGEE